MPQNKKIDVIHTVDLFTELNETSHLLDVIQSKIDSPHYQQGRVESICYLFELYFKENRRIMTDLAEVLDVEI